MLLISGCAAALPLVTPDDVRRADARWPGTDSVQLAQGRSLYGERCSGCHRLHLPPEYTDSAWEINVGKMKQKAKLTDGEERLILRYILSGETKPAIAARKIR